MKKLIIAVGVLVFGVAANGQFTSFDSLSIKQFIFQSVGGKFGLVTNDPEIFHSVIHGSREYVESQKSIEFQKALQRRKPIAIIKAKCK